VLSSSPPDRVKLQQQLEQPAAAAAPGRRGRRTSRKATASADPQPEPVLTPKAADPVIAAAATAEAVEAPAATSRRGRRTSRKATNSSDPLPSPADIIAASTGDGATEAKPTRRGRKTSRKATTSADPVEDPAVTPAQNSVAAAAEASATAATDNAAAEASTGAVNTKRGRRSKTTAVDPSPAAAEVQSAPAKADRARRTSRKSSVLEPETTGVWLGSGALLAKSVVLLGRAGQGRWAALCCPLTKSATHVTSGACWLLLVLSVDAVTRVSRSCPARDDVLMLC
jgi:hypothetical protein